MSANAAPPVFAIIILAWNHLELTLACLESVMAVDYPEERVRIYLADNGSSDGTPEVIRARHCAVCVIENGANLGYAGGNNAAIRCALAGSPDYVLILNNDTVVDTAVLNRLAAAGEAAPDAGAIGPVVYYQDEPARIWCAGAELDARTLESKRLRAEEVNSRGLAEIESVGFAPGCALCLRREAIESVGLFDERFFLYYEEADWCERARHAGWRSVLAFGARVWHRVSASAGAGAATTDYYMLRNALLFVSKHRHGRARWLVLARVAWRHLVVIAAYTAKPRGGRRKPHRNARVLALRDAALGRWGEMGGGVASACRCGDDPAPGAHLTFSYRKFFR